MCNWQFNDALKDLPSGTELNTEQGKNCPIFFAMLQSWPNKNMFCFRQRGVEGDQSRRDNVECAQEDLLMSTCMLLVCESQLNDANRWCHSLVGPSFDVSIGPKQ